MTTKETLGSLLYRSYSRSAITHMDMYNKRTYRIEDEEKFLKLYTNAFNYLSFTESGFHRYLLERSTGTGPIIVDVDLCERDLSEPKPLYTREFILKLVQSFQTRLKSLLTTKADLTCFVLEKPGYFKEDGTYKNGFHLHFPHVWLEEIERLYISRLIAKDTGVDLDESVIRGNWFMYGSKKAPDADPYLVTYMIEEARAYVPNTTYSNCELIHMLSVRVKPYTFVNSLSSMEDESLLPKSKRMKDCDPSSTYFTNYTKKSVKELKHYVKQLDKSVSEDYTSWRCIGLSLFNETHGEEYGRKIWHIFSRRCSEKYDESVCDTFWDRTNMGDSTSSLGTIIYYIKEGNDGKFKRYTSTTTRTKTKKVTTTTT